MKNYIIFALTVLLIASSLINIITIKNNDKLIETVNTPRTNISPSHYINKSQILVYDDKIVLNIPNASWFNVLPTGSMLPTLGSNSYAFGINVTSPKDITVGDIIIYKVNDTSNESIVHRITNISSDSNGTYYSLWGDNNRIMDKIKVRLENIKYKIVGLVY